MICLVLNSDTLEANLESVRNHSPNIDAVELRVDHLAGPERANLARITAAIDEAAGRQLPAICSVRRERDGGSYSGSESDRLRLLGAGIDAGFEYLDLEVDLRDVAAGRDLAARAIARGCEIIRSAHFPEGDPYDATVVLKDLGARKGEIAGLTVTPGSTADLLALLDAADATPGVRKVLDARGDYGAPARILSRRFGSMFTLVPGTAGEHGPAFDLDPGILVRDYRFRRITGDTKLFSIIGSPIAHSKSPQFHNARFAADDTDACYVAMLVDDVRAYFELADRLPLLGSSVTIPHKEAVLPFLAEVDEGTTAAGACNTVIRSDGGWSGVNTDVPGFLAPLRSVLEAPGEQGAGWTNLGATVIGAGGASRAIVYALLRQGARVLVLNRTAERAASLVADLRHLGGGGSSAASISWAPLGPDADITEHLDLIVQTTSVGMDGVGDPVPWLEFSGSEIVYDAVYTPPRTPLILRAEAAGCRTVTGDKMFAAQGEEQYRLFSRLALC